MRILIFLSVEFPPKCCDNFFCRLQEQIGYEKEQCEEYLAILYVDDFLRGKEIEMNNFCAEFKQQSLSDEKCDLLNNFFSGLYMSMRSNVLWNGECLFRIFASLFFGCFQIFWMRGRTPLRRRYKGTSSAKFTRMRFIQTETVIGTEIGK